MLANYALAFYRTLTRHRLYAALNTLGLALGIAVCATLLIVVRFETSFDRWIPGSERIVRFNKVNTFSGRPVVENSSTQAVLLPALLGDFPQQIEAGTRVWQQQVVVRRGGQPAYEDLQLVDPSVFDVFRLPFVAGEPRSALPDTNSLVVTQEMARKYFGTEKVVGRTLQVVLSGQPRIYRVTAVLKDVPPNSHFALGLIARYAPEVVPSEREYLDRWGSSFLYTYARLRSPGDATTLEAALPALIDRHAHDPDGGTYSHRNFHYRLDRLPDIHFTDSRIGAAFKPGADPLFITVLGVTGIVTLLVAIVNYVSLATARSGMRAREVAVRKVMGATRRALILQFLGESVALAFAAGLIALALVELSLPGVSSMLGEPIRLVYLGRDGVVAPLAGLCLLVGLASGVYPALALSRFLPASVLASARTPGGGRSGARVREVLAVGQFAIAIALMISTAVVFAQIQFVRKADLGFRRDGLVIVHGVGEPAVAPRMAALYEAIRATPGVVSATASDRRPATDSDSNSNVKLVSNPKIEPTLTFESIGPDYVKTYGLRVVAGRALDLAHGLDDRMGVDRKTAETRGLNIMINAAAARSLGFPDPARAVGQRLAPGGWHGSMQIVGVVADTRYQSPRTEVLPLVYMQDSRLARPGNAGSWTITARVNEADIPAVTRRLATVWRAHAPETPFRSETAEAALKPLYDPDARRGQLFAVGSGLSAAIACLGLFGLAAFNTSRRTKEIGIRKTLGASTTDVLRLLIGEFLRPVLWANLLAWPVAWLVMRAWLSGFDQRIDLNLAHFVIPSAAALLVAVATVAEQAIRVARAEPSRALRYE